MTEKQKAKMDQRLAEIQREMMSILEYGYNCEVNFKVCFNQITDWKITKLGHEDLEKI